MTSSPQNFKTYFSYALPHQLHNLVKTNFLDPVIDSKDYWHKFIIKNGSSYPKKDVLNAIINLVAPSVFIPVKYQVVGQDSSFLFQNGITAIKVLGARGLMLPLTPEITLYMNLELQFCPYSNLPIDPFIKIGRAAMKRIHVTETVVDLRDFMNDPDLQDIYANLSDPVVYMALFSAIKIVKDTHNKPCIVLLSHNGLGDSAIIDALMKHVPKIIGLDIRFNNFTWEAFLKFPTSNTMCQIWLDGNPMSDHKKYTSDYIIKKVRKIFPSLSKIDDVHVCSKPRNHIVPMKNFIIKENYTKMVDHFIHHYFYLYESSARPQLSRMYHPDATLSISLCHVGSEPATNHCINEYSMWDRNMLIKLSQEQRYAGLKKGSQSITQTLAMLPQVVFDLNYFQVDVPIAKKNKLVINVCGLFKNNPRNSDNNTDKNPDSNFEKNTDKNPDNFCAFDRTFILVPWKQVLGEWKIINDIWAINTAKPPLIVANFTNAKRAVEGDFAVLLPNKVVNEERMQKIFHDLTKLKPIYAVEYLTDANWNLEIALRSFINKHKAKLIPRDSFVIIEEEEETQ